MQTTDKFAKKRFGRRAKYFRRLPVIIGEQANAGRPEREKGTTLIFHSLTELRAAIRKKLCNFAAEYG